MADEFDPYYTWLGIRPEEQPADHYRLIGLRQFEENADVISNALDQKMQFLRTMQVGKRSALSQRLLNEISAAGGCLLDPARKQTYDKELRSKSLKAPSEPQKAAAAAAVGVSNRPLPKAVSLGAAPIPLPASQGAAVPRSFPSASPAQMHPAMNIPIMENRVSAEHDSPPHGNSISWRLPLVIGGAVVGGIVLGVMALVASRLLAPAPKEVAVEAAPATSNVRPNETPVVSKNPKHDPEKVPSPENKSATIEKGTETTPSNPPTKNPPTKNPPPANPPSTGPTPFPKGTEVPQNPPQAWWGDLPQLNRLLALEISENAQAEFPQSAGRVAFTTPLTAETWVRLHLEGEKPVQILGTRLGNQSGGFVPRGWALLARKLKIGETQKDQLILELWRTKGEFVQYTMPLQDAGQWHHIALIYEPGKGGRLFADGKRLFDFPAEKDFSPSGRNIGLGSDTQPAGVSFKAEFCGVRITEGIRYLKTFTPPSPLEMTADDSTFARLDGRLEAATAGPSPLAERGTRWIALGTGTEIATRPGGASVAAVGPKPSGVPKTPTTNPTSNPAPFSPSATATKKAAVPAGAVLAQGKSQVMAVFGEDIKAAKNAKTKQDVAKKMLDVVKDTNEMPSRYALLQEVSRLAVDAKDVSLAMRALEAIDQQFEIDLFAQKVKLLKSLAAEGLPLAQRGELLSTACELGYEAMEEGKIAETESLVATARSLAAKGVSPEAKTEAKEFFDAAAQRQKRLDALRRAEQIVANSPDDPGANLVLGLHHCWGRKDHRQGLPLLAKGSDAKLAVAAKARLQNIAKGITSSLEEADAWFDAIATVPADYKADVQRQALEGYSFLASAGTGLEKVKAEKRRDQLAAEIPAAPDKRVTKKLKKTDLPETSPGLVGRVLIDGKDAGYLLTHSGSREMDFSRLSELLSQTKAKGGRIILEGVISCPTGTSLQIFHQGRDGGPPQLLSINGKQVSAVGGDFGRSGNPQIPLPAGNHLLQWICDFDGSNTPRLDLYVDTGGSLRQIRPQFTRDQNYAARKIPTKTEMSLSNY